MTGHAYRTSARIAQVTGPFAGYPKNREPMLRVMGKHRAAVDQIDAELVQTDLFEAARTAWDEAIELGRARLPQRPGQRARPDGDDRPADGLRHHRDRARPGPGQDQEAGRRGLDVDRQPDRAQGPADLGYADEHVQAITEYVAANNTVKGAPALRAEHYEVFDCAMGDSPIHYMGHIRMMAATQPFLSGAISKTVNMPEQVTVEDVEHAYVQGWKLGLKALAIYWDNCKVGQPLSADRKVTTDTGAVIEVDEAPVRRRLPKQRPSRTTSFRVGDIEGYLTAGSYPDDGLGEIFVKVSKQGSTLSGVMDAFAIAVSVGLQYGVPLEALVAKFTNMIFEPNGMTDDLDVRIAQSLVDYLARRLAIDYLDVETRQASGSRPPPSAPPRSTAPPSRPSPSLSPTWRPAPAPVEPPITGASAAPAPAAPAARPRCPRRWRRRSPRVWPRSTRRTARPAGSVCGRPVPASSASPAAPRAGAAEHRFHRAERPVQRGAGCRRSAPRSALQCRSRPVGPVGFRYG